MADKEPLLEPPPLQEHSLQDPSSGHPSVQGKRQDDCEVHPVAVSPSTSSSSSDGGAVRKKWEGLTATLVLTVAAAVGGSSTQFGFNTGVLNSPKDAIRASFNGNGSDAGEGGGVIDVPFTDFEMTVAISIFAIGGMLGALPAGFLADLIGRKYMLLANNAVIVVGVCLQSFAVHPIMFILGRLVVGINSGLNTVLVPMYVSEISPVQLRGSMGVLHQMAIVSTILLSELLGLKELLGRPSREFYAWRILLAVPLCFAAFQLLLLPFCPQSPKFLYIKRKKEDAAIRALVRLRGESFSVEKEIKEMKDEQEEQQRPKDRVSMLQLVTRTSLRLPLITSIVLHLSQQLSGIVGILYYSEEIFKQAQINQSDKATLVVGATLVVVTGITVVLIELAGRRTLMLYGLGGMAVFFTFLTSMFCFQDGFYGNSSSSATVPSILLVISSLGITGLFALGPGGIPWLMVSELFQQEARPAAVTIATIVNWLANFAVGLSFPSILSKLYPYGTVVFSVTCSLLWVYLYLCLPETKGRSVEEVTAEYRRKAGETTASSSSSRQDSASPLST